MNAAIIFFLLLTDKSPFEGKSFKEILQKNRLGKIDFKLPKLKKNPVALDLLVKMLEIDPLDRISAKEVLQHEYFMEVPESAMDIEGESEENRWFGEYGKTQEQQRMAGGQTAGLVGVDSMVIRQNIITGRTDSVQESTNSKGAIFSFKSMASPKKPQANGPRESILKYVLLQNANQTQATIYGKNFTEEEIASDCEDLA